MAEVSVILPAYNNVDTIVETVESVKSQTFMNWELLAVDDCSSDDTRSTLDSLAKGDPRIRVMSTPKNSGAGFARNTGIEAASGRYVAFLDADDTWHSEKLQRQTDFMRGNGCLASFTYYRRKAPGDPGIRKIITAPDVVRYRDLLKSNWIPMSSGMYDRTRAPDLRMRSLRRRQDYLFWLDLLSGGGEARCIPECLMTYTVRAGSVSSNKLEAVRATWRLYRKELRLPWISAAYYWMYNVTRALTKRV